MTSSEVSSVDADATERRLRKLIARRFQFVHPTGPDGSLKAVVAVRVLDAVVDVVQMHAEDAVIATRVPASEADILAPSRVIWRSSGDVCAVLDDVLALPEEGVDPEPGEPPAS